MYSQYEEERFILDALRVIPLGRLLDLGAYHPTKFSNSRRLIELGWEATLVDCSPLAIERLVREYNGNPSVTVIQAAVDVAFSPQLIHLTDDAVSTFDPATHTKWKGIVPYYGSMVAYTVPVFQILSGAPYDFINIDLEGQSVAVFAKVLELTAQNERLPTCICVEYDEEKARVEKLAERYGYRITHCNGTNMVLAR